MRFTEAKLEEVFVESFKEKGYAHFTGKELKRDLEDVLLEEDLISFLLNQYKSQGLTHQEAKSIVMQVKTLPASDLYDSNKRFMQWLSDGFSFKREDRNQKDIWIYLIDYTEANQNIYKFVNQLEIVGVEKSRPDGVVYVNGLPLVVFEFKTAINPNCKIHDAYKQLTSRYRKSIPDLFVYNAFCVISDGVNNKAGSYFAPYNYYYAWRRVSGSNKEVDGINSMNTLLEGMFEQDRFRDIVQNFIYLPDTSNKEEKIVCRYPQYYAARALYKNIKKAQKPEGDGKGGTYFGATGSGKSYTMLFLTRLLMKSKHFQNPTIVLITDRTDLDDQLSGQFTNAKNFVGDNMIKSVESRSDLREMLQGRESGGVFLTTIHKFTEDINKLSDRTNIVCISDEAHRSQTNTDQNVKITKDGVKKAYGFAYYLHESLENATYVGFTGTPIDATLSVFGEVVDAYTMTESVKDEITVRIVYEGRAAKVALKNSEVEKIEAYYDAVAAEGANEYQIEQSKSQTARMNSILGNSERLRVMAKDFVEHYENRVNEGATVKGKAMFVCSSREIAYSFFKEVIALRPSWNEVKVAEEGVELTDQDKREIKPMDLPVPKENEFYTYAILCNNDSIYIGQTNNLQKRWELHLRGKAAEWTKKYHPVELFFYEKFNSREESVKREKELKLTSGRRFLRRKLNSDSARQTGRIKMIMTRNKDSDDETLYELLGTKEYRKELDRQFKNEKSNFKIAIVVDMWLTGFDVPFLDTIYIDKPIQQHNLIQTISRVNRTFKGKNKGLVVDYIGIKKQMNLAMKQFSDGEKENVEDIKQSMVITRNHLDLLAKLMHKFDGRKYFTGSALEQLHTLNMASEYVQTTKEMETRFMGLVKRLKAAYDLCSGSLTKEEGDYTHYYLAIRSIIFKLTKGEAPDSTQMNAKVRDMIQNALQSDGVEEIFKMGEENEKYQDLFDQAYIEKINKIKLPNTKIKLLQQLLNKAIGVIKKVNRVKGVDFTKKMESLVERYNDRDANDIFRSEVYEEMAEQLTNLIWDVYKEFKAGDDLGIDFEEKAFYDILKELCFKYDFTYPEDKLIELAKSVKKLVDGQAKYPDWNKRADIKSALKVGLIILLDEHGYPPVERDEVYKEIFEQAENYKKYNQ